MQGRKLATVCATAALALAALQAPAQAQTPAADAKRTAHAAIDRNAAQLATIGDSLYWFGELGMQEFESAKFLKETLERIGFRVEVGGAGMPTNVWAEWGSGKPKIVIVTEIDALPEGNQTPLEYARKPMIPGAPGHMEGHNTHGAVAIGAAYALKQAMERHKIPGTVAISFGPAEEQLLSRPYLVRAGYFKDADAAMLIHIGDNLSTGFGLQNYAAISTKFTFRGKTSHGAVNPWDGRDAVDAVELMSIGYDKLREHLRPTQRGHRTITMGGVQPNIIPDLGQIWWFVRDATGPWAKENHDKLVDIAKGAALMTRTTMEMETIASAWPQLGNQVIAEAIQKNIDAVGLPQWTSEEVAFARGFQKSLGLREVGLSQKPMPFSSRPQGFASNDNGDVTWNVPSGYMTFPSSVPGVGYHNWQAAVTPTSTIAHKGQVAGAKVLASTMIDMFTSPELVARAKARFDEDTKDTRYFSLLPENSKPPLDLNRETMERYRAEMRKHYLNRSVRFE